MGDDNLYHLLRSAHSVARSGTGDTYGVEVALVTNVRDPDQQGRVKLCFPRLPGKPESDWARVVQPAAGDGRGFYWLPHVNDEVLVAFERGQVNRPYVIASLWNGKDKPIKDGYQDENTTVMVQSKSGHQLVIDDKKGQEKIVLGDKSGKRTMTFDVQAKKFLVECKEGDLELHAEKKIVLTCEDIEIKTKKSGKIEIGDKFNLRVEQKAQLKAGSQFNLKADKVELNPTSFVDEILQAAAEAAAQDASEEEAGGTPDHMEAVEAHASPDLSSDPAPPPSRVAYYLSHRLVARGGTPFVEQEVQIVDADTGEAVGQTHLTDADGNLFVEVPNNAPYHIRVVDPDTPDEALPNPLGMSGIDEAVLTVRLVDASGTALANEQWQARRSDGMTFSGTTDAQGDLLHGAADPGVYELTVRGHTYKVHTIHQSRLDPQIPNRLVIR